MMRAAHLRSSRNVAQPLGNGPLMLTGAEYSVGTRDVAKRRHVRGTVDSVGMPLGVDPEGVGGEERGAFLHSTERGIPLPYFHLGLCRVDLGQELLDGDRRVRRADRAQHVESVLGKRQLGVHDGLPADFP